MNRPSCASCGQLFESPDGNLALCPLCRTTSGKLHATLLSEVPCGTLPPLPSGNNTLDEQRSPAGYEVLGELGRGGMGVVYKAKQTALGRIVALKMILSGPHAGADEAARFHTEAEAIARLQHPNIVQVFEIGEHQGRAFLSLEFCEGGSLETRLAGTPMPVHEVATLVRFLAFALQAAHEAKVIHRDLKPGNVLLTANGTPKVTDFGLAKKLDEVGHTQTGSVMGTPSYMAPEQAEGRKDIGPLADVYSLGAILYECLTGRPPFRAATAMDTLLQVLDTPPAPPSLLNRLVPAELEAICLKCLEKMPRERYTSAADLAADLSRFLAGEPVIAERGTAGRLLRSWLRESRQTELLSVHAKAWRLQALLVFPLFLLTNILIWWDCPTWIYVALWLPGVALLQVPVFYHVYKPGRVWASVEKQMTVVLIALGTCAAVMLLDALILGLPLPKLIPLFMAVLGLAFASFAVLLGGTFYLLAGLCALSSVVAALFPSIGPGFFGLIFSIGLLVPSLRNTKTKHSP